MTLVRLRGEQQLETPQGQSLFRYVHGLLVSEGPTTLRSAIDDLLSTCTS
jgi:hypothetical protein